LRIALSTSPQEGETVLNPNPKFVVKDFIKYPPLALLSIVRNLDAGHELKIYDANESSFDDLVQDILRFKPDLVGISAVTERFYGVVKLARAVKANLPGTKIIIGGSHADLYPEETMTHAEFDYLLSGPCELTFPRFVEWLDGAKNVPLESIDNLCIRNQSGFRWTSRKKIHQLDGYPFPDRKRIDLKKYSSLSDRHLMTTMNSSRGCPFRCVYCNVPRGYLTRSAPYIVDEIEEILGLGIREIHILDDTFNIDRQRVLDICGLIKKRNLKFRWSTRARLQPFDEEIASVMKEAGCFRLNLGVESHNPGILEYINKKVTRENIVKGFEIIHRFGFETTAFFIIGFPGQTVEDARKTMDFVKEIRPTFILMNALIALPFSDFYFELLKKEVYREDHWKNYVLRPIPDYRLPSWRGERLDEVFLNLRDELMKKFYLSPSFVAREIVKDVTALDFAKLGRKMKLGFDWTFGRIRS